MMFVLLPPTAPDMLPMVGAAHKFAVPNIQRPLSRDLKGSPPTASKWQLEVDRGCFVIIERQ